MKYVYVLCCLLLLSGALSAQNYDPDWDASGFNPGPYKLNSVTVRDLRIDTIAANLNATDKNKDQSLSQPIEQFYQGLSAATGTPNDLLILLHHFYIHEGEKGYFGSPKSYLRFKAEYLLGSQEIDSFRLLGQVDTLVTLKGRHAATKTLQRLYQDMVPAEPPVVLTRAQAVQMAIEAKQKWPVFKETRAGNAVYTTWQDFLQLQAKAERNIIPDGIDFKIEYVNSKGKRSLAPVSYCKVFSYKDNLFFVTERGPMPMRRKGSDFYVSSDKDLMGMGLGVMPYNNGIGVRIPISRRPENGYEYKVDIKSGQLVPVR